jgi:hypothetical protein
MISILIVLNGYRFKSLSYMKLSNRRFPAQVLTAMQPVIDILEAQYIEAEQEYYKSGTYGRMAEVSHMLLGVEWHGCITFPARSFTIWIDAIEQEERKEYDAGWQEGNNDPFNNWHYPNKSKWWYRGFKAGQSFMLGALDQAEWSRKDPEY